jgi:hypothetical protein
MSSATLQNASATNAVCSFVTKNSQNLATNILQAFLLISSYRSNLHGRSPPVEATGSAVVISTEAVGGVAMAAGLRIGGLRSRLLWWLLRLRMWLPLRLQVS